MKKIFIALCLFLMAFWIFSQTNNTSRPEKGRWDFKKNKLWETESEGKDIIGLIQSVEISQEGKVYIIDEKNFKVCIYGKDGKFIKSFGTRGEGPGEIKEFYGGDQLHLSRSSLIIEDRSRIHYFTPEGNFKHTITIPSRLKARKFISDDVLISAPVTVNNPGKKGSEIIIYNIKTKEEEVIASFKPFKKATNTQRSGGRTVTIGIVIGNITPLMFISFHHNTLYYGMSSKYEISYLNLKSRNRGTFSLQDRRPHKVSDQFKENLKSELGDVPADMLKKIFDGLPPRASFFENIIADDNGNLYVFVSNPDLKHRKDIDIFNRKGEYIYAAQISIDAGSEITIAGIKGDQLVLVIEDEEGNQKIAKYKIRVPAL